MLTMCGGCAPRAAVPVTAHSSWFPEFQDNVLAKVGLLHAREIRMGPTLQISMFVFLGRGERMTSLLLAGAFCKRLMGFLANDLVKSNSQKILWKIFS